MQTASHPSVARAVASDPRSRRASAPPRPYTTPRREMTPADVEAQRRLVHASVLARPA